MDLPSPGALTAGRAGQGRAAKWVSAAVVSALLGAGLFFITRYQDRWVRTQSAPGIDGAVSLVFSLEADAPVSGWLRNSTPTLRVSCASGRVSLYVQTELPAAVEAGSTRTVRLQFDDDAPTIDRWEQSTNHQSLFPPADAAPALAEHLAHSRRFRFAFVPFRAEAVVATFSVYGFAEHWHALEEACPAG